MELANANSHLTREDRSIIEIGVRNGSTKTAISRTLGKDNSTIGKEIKQHRYLKHKSPLPLECTNYRKCKHGRACTETCPDYEKFICKRRDRSPGACNGCKNFSYCRFDKYIYEAGHAQSEYEATLVDSRTGFNITSEGAKALGERIKPFLKQGLSPYAILQACPDLGVCEKTIYTYLENCVFSGLVDIGPLDLRRQVKRKMTRKNAKLYKKREDRRFLIGRTYKDYKTYMEEHPNALVTQMDTVYNDVTNGPFIQTFKLVDVGVLLAFRHEKKTAEAMTAGVDHLEAVMGTDPFRKHVHVLLSDRGSEFSDADGIERGTDELRRTRVFYCDPMQSGQKGTLENNHIELRFILPKGTDLKALGLVNQDALNLVLSHVNSIPIEKFGGKTPLDMLEFMYPDLFAKLVIFGIRKIPVKDLILKPYLLKIWKKEQEDKQLSNDSDSTGPASSSSDITDSNAPADNVIVESNSGVADPASSNETDTAQSKFTHPGGRKLKSSAISSEQIRQLIADGRSPKEIADMMGVSIATYYRRLALLNEQEGS